MGLSHNQDLTLSAPFIFFYIESNLLRESFISCNNYLERLLRQNIYSPYRGYFKFFYYVQKFQNAAYLLCVLNQYAQVLSLELQDFSCNS